MSYADDWMNKADIIELMQKEHGLSKAWARDIVETFLSTIGGSLALDKKVMIRNFGKFEMRESHGSVRPKFDGSKNLTDRYGDANLVAPWFEARPAGGREE